MHGTANRALLFILISISAVVGGCADATSPTPEPRPSAPLGKSATADTATSTDTAPPRVVPPSSPAGPLVGDSISGLVFLRDGAIWQTSGSGSQPTGLLQPSNEINAAAASRNGSIAFATGMNQICVAAPGASVPRCVSADHYDITGLAWSPDGSQVVFSGVPLMPGCSAAAPCMAPRMDLLSLSISSMAVRPLVLNPDGSYALGASWSPDGSTIAFAMGGGIWLVNADGSQPRLLKDQVGGSYAVIAVRWSPDARKLAVSLEGTAHCPWFCDTAVGTVNADGSGMRVLATAMEAASQFVGASPHGAPIWSPDGGRIAFGRSDCSAGWDPCREQEWLVDAAGGAPQLLLDSATLLAWYGE